MAKNHQQLGCMSLRAKYETLLTVTPDYCICSPVDEKQGLSVINLNSTAYSTTMKGRQLYCPLNYLQLINTHHTTYGISATHCTDLTNPQTINQPLTQPHQVLVANTVSIHNNCLWWLVE